MYQIWLILAAFVIAFRIWRQRIRYTGVHHTGTVHHHRIGNARVSAEWYACQLARVRSHRVPAW